MQVSEKVQDQIGHQRSAGLTKHKPGSFLELFTISLPLMVASLSGSLMLFFDRIILSWYSIDAMNTAATVGITAAIFHYGASSITSISEVLAAQNNGAGHYKKVGAPIWQMIWFSVFCWGLYILIAYFFTPYLVSERISECGNDYFKILLYGGLPFPLLSALVGYFVAIGQTRFIMIMGIFANALNAVLAFALVFGVPPFFEGFGVNGAAYATVLALSLQGLVLLTVFLSRKNHEKYNTRDFRINFSMMSESLKIGLPSSIGHIVEISGWALITNLLAAAGAQYITAMTVGQSFFMLFTFATDGLQKGVTAVTANLIGAKRVDIVPQVIRSGVKLVLLLATLLAIPIYIFSEDIIYTFVNANNVQNPELLTPEFYGVLKLTLTWIVIFFIVNYISWIFAGVLTAGGDTRYLMFVGIICGWVFDILPTYVAVYKFSCPADYVWRFVILYGLANIALYYYRYRSNKWCKNLVT